MLPYVLKIHRSLLEPLKSRNIFELEKKIIFICTLMVNLKPLSHALYGCGRFAVVQDNRGSKTGNCMLCYIYNTPVIRIQEGTECGLQHISNLSHIEVG